MEAIWGVRASYQVELNDRKVPEGTKERHKGRTKGGLTQYPSPKKTANQFVPIAELPVELLGN